MTSALELLGDRARPLTLAEQRVLPVRSPFEQVLPGAGLQRGSVVALGGAGATSLAVALVAGASQAGSWTAIVGLPALGLVGAVELGLDLERLVVVAPPPARSWATVVGILLDAFEVVLVSPGSSVRLGDARRLMARARDRGAVLVQAGGRADAWPEAPDLSLRIDGARWSGLVDGHGHLRCRRVSVEVQGRRRAARARRVELWLPGPDGMVALAAPVPKEAPMSPAAPVAPVAVPEMAAAG